MEKASDILVVLGALLIVGALGYIWRPLGVLALGLGCISLGFVFAVKAKQNATTKSSS